MGYDWIRCEAMQGNKLKKFLDNYVIDVDNSVIKRIFNKINKIKKIKKK